MENISQEVINSISANLGNDIYNFAKIKFQEIKYKNEASFIKKLQEYVAFSTKKLGNVKTLFYDSKAQNLLDFYEPLKVMNNSRNSFYKEDQLPIDTSSISNLMTMTGNILFTGNGGCGKTMLLKYLFLNTFSEEYKIPVYIELRLYNNFSGSFTEFVYKSIKEMHFNIDREYFLYTLKGNKYLFLFDAFDEVYPEKVEQLSNEMKSFCNLYSLNKYILSSRFSYGFMDWNDFTEYKVCRLTKQQSISLINKIDVHHEIKKDFLADLKEKLYEKYESFASSPLLLNIMLITYEGTSTLPDKLNGFYEKAFEALFYSHDLSKNRYKRKLKSGLGYEDVKTIFNRVCFKSYIKSDFTFNFDEIISLIEEAKAVEKINSFTSEDYLEDLETYLCMFIKEGFEYYFTHRSFQEYFTASFIQNRTDIEQIKIFKFLLKTESNHISGI